MAGFQKCLGPQLKAQHAYTDGSKEFEKALAELEISHDTSTPSRPQTNGVAERAVRRVKEVTACTQDQPGFNDEWWAEAMSAYCFLRNIVDILKDRSTAYKMRYGIDFQGPVVPFGAQIKYNPISQKDKERVHKFGDKTLSGVFIGYAQQAGGGWSGDLIIADWEEIENADTASEIYPKRFKAAEITVIKQGEQFCFPLAEGNLRQPGDLLPHKQRRRKQHRKEDVAETKAEEDTATVNEPEVDHEPDFLDHEYGRDYSTSSYAQITFVYTKRWRLPYSREVHRRYEKNLD